VCGPFLGAACNVPDETKGSHAHGLQVSVSSRCQSRTGRQCGVVAAPAGDLERRAKDLGAHKFSHGELQSCVFCDRRG
jgi:hypothetical protein